MKTYLYRALNLKSTITFMASVSQRNSFLAPAKNRHFLRFIHNNYHNHQLLQTVPEICAFIVGFSCTV